MQLSGRHAGLIVPVGMVAAAVLTVTLLGRPPAAAALTAATPAPGADLGAPPAAIVLSFSATVDQAHVSVSGARADRGPSIDGSTVTQPLAATAAGSHVVSYHVVTRDGEEIAGTVPFTVGGSGQGSGAGGGAGSGGQPAPAGHEHGSGLDGLTAVVLGANVLVLLVLGGMFLRRRDGGAGPGGAGEPAGVGGRGRGTD